MSLSHNALVSVVVPPAHVYTAGSTMGTTAVVVTSDLVSVSMFCQLDDEYISVVWFVYQNLSKLQVSQNQEVYTVKQNGQNLQIQNMVLATFLMLSFECRLLSSHTTIPIANFTTVGISGIN